jgi:predicted adenine nucleotide alpha hydrolase (AANH) superfamily ATPase
MIDKLIRVYITVCWSFFVFKLLTLPMPTGPSAGLEITYADKLVHFFIFGLLSYFLTKTLELFTEKHHRTVLIVSLILPTFYGLMLEYLQESIPGRSASLLDASAGITGSLLAIWIYHFVKKHSKPKLLLHICCVGCGAFVSRELTKDFQVTLYFYNPNISPAAEYELRLAETKKIAKRFGYKLLPAGYDHDAWLKLVSGHEQDPEKGARCLICYRERLDKTAKIAQESGFAYFASTLTVSPHKLAGEINAIGEECALKYGVKFLNRDFKKQDGFKKSLEMSKELGLYRQNYCGCEFSKRADLI